MAVRILRKLEVETPRKGPHTDLFSGPTKTQFSYDLAHVFLPQAHCQVRSFLQWAKVIRARAGKAPLFINFDETAMKFNYAKLKGLIVSKKHLPPGKKHRKEQISSSEAKASVSFLAFITADPAIQDKLPQIILGNKHQLTAALVAELAPSHQFYVWREESGWINKKIMNRVLTLLSKCLKDIMVTRQVVLVMDTYSAHMAESVLAYASRLNILLLFVPAKLTPLLQPADTHLFGKLKRKLKEKWVQLRMQDENGKVSHKLWLAVVFQVCREVMLATTWQAAFESAGLLGEHVSDRVLEQLGWEALPPISAEIPSCEQLQSIFPKGRKVAGKRASLFKFCLPKAKAKPKPKAEAKAKAAAKAAAYAPNLD